MNLSNLIAFRYLFSKKRTHAINLISAISMFGFGVGAFAIIIVLSTMNGFESLVSQMVNHFDAELKISHKEKKLFDLSSQQWNEIKSCEGVQFYTPVIEDKAVVVYQNKQEIIHLKGVSQEFLSKRGFDSSLFVGSSKLHKDSFHLALFGSGIANSLGIPINREYQNISFYVPKAGGRYQSFNPMKSLNQMNLLVGGIFQIHPEIDNEYVLCNLAQARVFFDHPSAVSSIELMMNNPSGISKVQKDLRNILGDKFLVETRKEQNRSLYKIFKSEKWISFSILFFILLIAGFNLIGNLSMLVLEKKQDMALLKSLGMSNKNIQLVFLKEGFLVALIGGVGGLILGIALLAIHQEFGLLKLEGAVVDFYPVKVLWKDVAIILVGNIFLGFLLSVYPSNRAPKIAEF